MRLLQLLTTDPLSLLLLIVQLVLVTVFVPFRVNRPERARPYVTYALMFANIFIFLSTIAVANIELPSDQVQAGVLLKDLIARAPQTITPDGQRRIGSLKDVPGFPKPDNADGYRQLWQLQHLNASVVFEPHYSALNVFAYRVARPSLLGLLASMFLHAGLMHLLGNMLYLWVFGRAMEESLGPKIYGGAYLLCGLAAVLAFHIITRAFTPQDAGLPFMGASGAIAGVMGFFALRFYRTPVSVFYVQPITVGIVTLIGLLIGSIASFMLGILGFIAGFVGVWIAFVMYARKLAFGTFQVKAAILIGIWLVGFNLLPALRELFGDAGGGGVAYWAHIGGFGFGLLYAYLIGGQDEGKSEYLLEDAQKALTAGHWARAIEYAGSTLQREPANFAAIDVAARAHDALNHDDLALRDYEAAITGFIRTNARPQAVSTYRHARQKHGNFLVSPGQQLVLGAEMAHQGDFAGAAHTIVQIPYAFPNAPEAEVGLLRAATLYLERLGQPDVAMQLLHEFMTRYPHSPWLPQAQKAWQMAQMRLNESV